MTYLKQTDGSSNVRITDDYNIPNQSGAPADYTVVADTSTGNARIEDGRLGFDAPGATDGWATGRDSRMRHRVLWVPLMRRARRCEWLNDRSG